MSAADAGPVDRRLRELRLALPVPAEPLGTYRPAVRSGDAIYVSGQVATRDGAVVHPGILGYNVTVEQGQAAAQAAALNALAAVTPLASLEDLRVIRLVGYVASASTFHQQSAVVDGASQLLRAALGEERGVGTRLALGVASLPAQSPVELELIFEVVPGGD